jgi:starch synthase (maltosyl-transferring)
MFSGRVIIESVRPEVDAGRFPIKRVVGETVEVEADAFADGHDLVACAVRFRRAGTKPWQQVRMEPIGNDRYRGSFRVASLGEWEYTVAGWVDAFASWRRDLTKKLGASQDVTVDLLEGAELGSRAARKAKGEDRKRLLAIVDGLDPERALSDEFAALMDRYLQPTTVSTYDRVLDVFVGPPQARYSTWYEFFPRSLGTLKDAEEHLGYVARMGFDVVYLPPVHPIGITNRKGKNNVTTPDPDDPGSPWAIGSSTGGHTAIDPGLGTLDDFKRFITKANACGLDIALDLAFQCSPDHPWVTEHPEWFRHRPDGSIAYAENPPKRYEDIYPIDFDTEAREELWVALREVVDFWIDFGIRIFRVDNPHTKPFAFWEWLLSGVHMQRPDVVFLAEAFTRPKVMYRLAKLGFDQSVTYFTWRTAKWELEQYFTELKEAADFFRPNLWPNTPDILPYHLQNQGAPAFMTRFVLAATLGATYGIYGPAFELQETAPLAPGKEEYLNSEKFELRDWKLEDPNNLAEFIAHVNRIRAENVALHSDRTLRFHEIQNDNLIAYSKCSEDGANVIVCVVNLDPNHTQSGMLHLPLEDFGMRPDESFPVHDLLTEARFVWHGEWNYVELDPHSVPAHVLRLRHRMPSEEDFEYYA